jgi:hypothetical protein
MVLVNDCELIAERTRRTGAELAPVFFVLRTELVEQAVEFDFGDTTMDRPKLLIRERLFDDLTGLHFRPHCAIQRLG